MTQTIYLDGTDQYLLVRLGGVDTTTGAQSLLLGEVNGESLQTQISDIVVVWAEYKKESVVVDTDIIWDSSIGIWKVPIPSEYITQTDNTAWISISGTNSDNSISIIPTLIDVDVPEPRVDILDEVIDPTHHNTPKSLARLLYILYCGEIGNVLNTRTSRTILNENGQVIVSNTITNSNTSVTRTGGFE